MQQLFKIEELIGKTIEQTIVEGDEAWMKFTDGSFAVIDIKTTSEGFSYDSNHIVISEWKKDNTSQELVELGLITRKDYDFAVEQDEIKTQARRKERDEEEKKRHRDSRKRAIKRTRIKV